MKKRVYNAAESAEFIKKFLSIPKYEIVKRVEEIKIKPPLVLKILSKKAIHKTEFKGIEIIKYKESLKPAFNEIVKNTKRHKIPLEGVMVQEFIEGIESIIGIKKDDVFGHVIVFGVGGIFTEIISDTSTRKCPINSKDAEEMINELRLHKLFYDARGIKPNIECIKKALVSVSKIPEKYPKISELDLNPFIVNDKNCSAVDCRLISE